MKNIIWIAILFLCFSCKVQKNFSDTHLSAQNVTSVSVACLNCAEIDDPTACRDCDKTYIFTGLELTDQSGNKKYIDWPFKLQFKEDDEVVINGVPYPYSKIDNANDKAEFIGLIGCLKGAASVPDHIHPVDDITGVKDFILSCLDTSLVIQEFTNVDNLDSLVIEYLGDTYDFNDTDTYKCDSLAIGVVGDSSIVIYNYITDNNGEPVDTTTTEFPLDFLKECVIDSIEITHSQYASNDSTYTITYVNGNAQDTFFTSYDVWGEWIVTVGDTIYTYHADDGDTTFTYTYYENDTLANGQINITQYLCDQSGDCEVEFETCKEPEYEITVSTENVDSTRLDCECFTIDLADYTTPCEDQFGNILETDYALTSIPTADAIVYSTGGSLFAICPDEETCAVAQDIVFSFAATCEDGTESESVVTIDFPDCALSCTDDLYVTILGTTATFRPLENDDLMCTDGTTPSIIIDVVTPTTPPSTATDIGGGYVQFIPGVAGEIDATYSLACGGIACDQTCTMTINVVEGSPLNDTWYTPNDTPISGNSVIDDVTCSDQDCANYSWIDANGDATSTPPTLVFGTLTGTPCAWTYTPQLNNCSQQSVPYVGPCGIAYIILNTSGCIVANDDSNECWAASPPNCTENLLVNDACSNSTQVLTLIDCNGNDITTFPHPLYECNNGCADGCTTVPDATILGVVNGEINITYTGTDYDANGEKRGCIDYRLDCVDPDGNVIESETACSEHIFRVPPPEIELNKNIAGTLALGDVTINLEVCNTSTTNDIASGADNFSVASSTMNGTAPTTWTFVSSTMGSPNGELLVGECATYTGIYTVVQADVDQESIVCSMQVDAVDEYGQAVSDLSDDDGNGDSAEQDDNGDDVPDDDGDDDPSELIPAGCSAGEVVNEIRSDWSQNANCLPDALVFDGLQHVVTNCTDFSAIPAIGANYTVSVVTPGSLSVTSTNAAAWQQPFPGSPLVAGNLNLYTLGNPGDMTIDYTYPVLEIDNCAQQSWGDTSTPQNLFKIRAVNKYPVIITFDVAQPTPPVYSGLAGCAGSPSDILDWTTPDGGFTWNGYFKSCITDSSSSNSGTYTWVGDFNRVTLDRDYSPATATGTGGENMLANMSQFVRFCSDCNTP